MFLRLPKGSKWKLRLVIIVVSCFLALALFSKWAFVSQGGRLPFVRIPAFLISKRKNSLPIGTPIYADARKEDLLKISQIKNTKDSIEATSSSLQMGDVSPGFPSTYSRGVQFRGKDGDIFLHSFGKIFNVFIWDEICGESLDNLFNYPLFPYMPSRKRFSKSFKIINYGKNFALWLVGYFTPFCDGQHHFELEITAGNSEVWISEDSTRNKLELVLTSTGKERVMRKDLRLKKEEKYYFEVFHKEGNRNSEFNIKISTPEEDCLKAKQPLAFEPFMSPETIWSVKTPVVHLKDELLAKLKDKAKSSKSQSPRSKRDDIFKIPFIEESDIATLLPKCKYDPSYIVKYRLEKYEGVWETHFSSIYPSDDTNITDLLSSGERQIIFGNDIMDESVAMKAVYQIMSVIKQKLPG